MPQYSLFGGLSAPITQQMHGVRGSQSPDKTISCKFLNCIYERIRLINNCPTGDRTLMFHQGKIIFAVAGDQHDSRQVEDLLHLFKRQQGEKLEDARSFLVNS